MEKNILLIYSMTTLDFGDSFKFENGFRPPDVEIFQLIFLN